MSSRSGTVAGRLLPIVAIVLAAWGCGSSDDVPQVGDNPAAKNATSFEELGDRARVRSEKTSHGGAPKRTIPGD